MYCSLELMTDFYSFPIIRLFFHFGRFVRNIIHFFFFFFTNAIECLLCVMKANSFLPLKFTCKRADFTQFASAIQQRQQIKCHFFFFQTFDLRDTTHQR